MLEIWHPCSLCCWYMQTNKENDISQTQTSANTYTKLKVSSCQTPTWSYVTHSNTLLSQHTHMGSLQPALTASQTSQPKPVWGLFSHMLRHCQPMCEPDRGNMAEPGCTAYSNQRGTSSWVFPYEHGCTHTEVLFYPSCPGQDTPSSLLPMALPLSYL